MVRRAPRVAWLAWPLWAVLAALAACASPTLPLPPPETPIVGKGSDADHVTLTAPCGGAEPDAKILVFNDDPKVPSGDAVGGARVDGCGAWSTEVYALPGDVLNVEQTVGTQASPPVDVQVP